MTRSGTLRKVINKSTVAVGMLTDWQWNYYSLFSQFRKLVYDHKDGHKLLFTHAIEDPSEDGIR